MCARNVVRCPLSCPTARRRSRRVAQNTFLSAPPQAKVFGALSPVYMNDVDEAADDTANDEASLFSENDPPVQQQQRSYDSNMSEADALRNVQDTGASGLFSEDGGAAEAAEAIADETKGKEAMAPPDLPRSPSLDAAVSEAEALADLQADGDLAGELDEAATDDETQEGANSAEAPSTPYLHDNDDNNDDDDDEKDDEKDGDAGGSPEPSAAALFSDDDGGESQAEEGDEGDEGKALQDIEADNTLLTSLSPAAPVDDDVDDTQQQGQGQGQEQEPATAAPGAGTGGSGGGGWGFWVLLVAALAAAVRGAQLGFDLYSCPEFKDGAFSFDAQNKGCVETCGTGYVRESPAYRMPACAPVVRKCGSSVQRGCWRYICVRRVCHCCVRQPVPR